MPEPMPSRVLPVSVVDGEGRAVAGAWVGTPATLGAHIEALTDATGRAELRLPGDLPLHCVMADKSGFGTDYALFWRRDEPRTDPYRLDADAPGPVALVLDGAKPVTVRAVDPAGRPLEGVRIHPWLLTRPRRGDQLNLSYFHAHVSRTTGPDGIVTLDTLPADQVKPVPLTIFKQGYGVPTRCVYDPATGGGSALATLVPLVPVAGTVIGPDGRPAAGATVTLEGVGYTLGHFTRRATTDANGRFTADVQPDMYYLFAAADPRRRLASAAVGRVVRAGLSTDPVPLHLRPATRVHGRVVFADDGHPVPGVTVVLQRQDDSYDALPASDRLPPGPVERRITPLLPVEHRTDAAGAFEFHTGSGEYHLWVRGRGQSSPHQPLTIRDEVDLPVDLSVGPGVADRLRRLAGRLVWSDRPDVPVPGGAIAVIPIDLSANLPRQVIADGDGRFELGRGSVDLYLHATFPDRDSACLVRVPAAETSATLAVGPTATLVGRLLDEHGRPAGGRTINLIVSGLRTSLAFVGTATTAPDGRFALPGVVPGHDYELWVDRDRDSVRRARDVWCVAEPVRADRPGPVDVGDRQLPG